MAHIDYYFTTLSPFTYLAGTRLEEIAARHGASITYKPLDIDGAVRAHRAACRRRTATRAGMEYRAQELLRLAKKLGHAAER